jgi:tetratricopeptide (TPR) repeat protein
MANLSKPNNGCSGQRLCRFLWTRLASKGTIIQARLARSPTAGKPNRWAKRRSSMQNNKSSLQLGITAFKSGDKDQARVYFLRAIREEPDNEQAWGWLSNTALNLEERIHCLRQIVKINPQNTSAQKLLSELENAQKPVVSDQSTPPLDTATFEQSLKNVITEDPLYRRNRLYALASSIQGISVFLIIPLSPSLYCHSYWCVIHWWKIM